MANLTSKLTLQLVDDVSKPARSVAEALAAADRRVREIAKDMSAAGASDKLTTSLAKLKTQKTDIEQAAKAWRDYSKSANLGADASKWTKTDAANVKAWERQTLSSVRAVINERRKEALAETAMLHKMDAERAASHNKMHKWFGGERNLAGTLGAAVVGEKMAEAGKSMAEKAAEVEQLRFRVRELSRGDKSEAPLADNLVSDVIAKYPSVSRAKAYDTYLEMRANSLDVQGRIDPVAARRNLMAASQAQRAASALGVEMTPLDVQNIVKTTEGSGRAADPEGLSKMFDTYLRFKQVMGSAFSADKMRDFVANAKGANFSLGDAAQIRSFVELAEGNASRLGNETNQTLATLAGGHMTKAAGQWMVDHGLARADQIVKNGPGAISIKGGLKDSDTLSTNPDAWAATTLRTAVEASGAVSDQKVDDRMRVMRDQDLKANPNAKTDDRVLRERAEHALLVGQLQGIGVKATVVDKLAHAIANQRLVDRDVKAVQKASGMDAGARLGENPIAAFNEFSTAIGNFGSVLASPAIAAAGPALDNMARGLASITASLADFQKLHPDAAALLGGGVIGGAVLGGGALTYGALSGLMSGFGLTGSATALTGSAAELTAAAAMLKGGAVVTGGVGGAGAAAGAGGVGLGLGAASALLLADIAVPVMAGMMAKWLQDKYDPTQDLRGHLKKAPYSFSDEITGGAQDEPIVPRRYPAAGPSGPSGANDNTSLSAKLEVDSTTLDTVKPKADEASAALDPLSRAISLNVDTAAIDAAIAKANQLQNALNGLRSAAGAIKMPSLGSTLRGNFTTSGQQGE